jgi:hypothetical protein
MQTYPADKRFLIIMDDDGYSCFDNQQGSNWELLKVPRPASLPAKYNKLLRSIPTVLSQRGLSHLIKDDYGICVWEDDDNYLPTYLELQAKCLQTYELSRPPTIITDYPEYLIVEGSGGRFHSSLAFRSSLIKRMGGWIETTHSNFDLQMIARLEENATSIGEPWSKAGPIPYIYRWHTGAAHGQWSMDGHDDPEWYNKAIKTYIEKPFVGKLVPQLDERTKVILHKLMVKV